MRPGEPDEAVAALFVNGGSQAVRLPKAFRFAGKAVRARRLPGGRVLLEPIRKAAWPKGYWERLASLPGMGEALTRPPESPGGPDRDDAIASLGGRKRARSRKRG